MGGMTAIHDFYYLILGSHYYDESIAEADDWHGDVSQRIVWLKQFGDKCLHLNSVDTGHSFVGATHGLLEYQAIICSLLNVDFMPPSDNHSSKIIHGITTMIAQTVGSIKMFQYEWVQAEVMIGAAKLCILRGDIMYSSMKPITIILKECDRLLTMLESKVLVQLAIHLMKVVVIHCPMNKQDLLLKELSALISDSKYKKRAVVPLNQLLLLTLVAIDRYNIQNSKTWQKIAAIPIFACCHDKQQISDLGEEVLWRIYTFAPGVGEDILSKKMDKKKAKQVRKALGMEDYWSEQQKQRGEMKTIKLYHSNDPLPVGWTKTTYNPTSNEMSPARLWSMMQQSVYGDIELLDQLPTLGYDDFVSGFSDCQSYLRSASIRALFQCLPRKHRPFVTKEEFIEFVCATHSAPNRRHYALRIKELLTIIEDKWKTEAAEKQRIADIKRQEREQKKREKEEKKRQKEIKRKEKEILKRQKEIEKEKKLEAELAKMEREQEEMEKLEQQQNVENEMKKFLEEQERERAEAKKKRKEKREGRKRKKQEKRDARKNGTRTR